MILKNGSLKMGRFKKGREGYWKGKTFSEEHRKKIGEASKGNKYSLGYKHSEEHKRKVSLALIGHKGYWKGKTFSEEHKRKMGKNSKGNKYALGYKHSEEHKLKLSLDSKINPNYGMKGKKHSKESILKMSLTKKGKKLSEGHKRKLSEANIGKNLREKNGNWLGGISFEPYTEDFDEQFRILIRERDKNFCVLCNKHQRELKRIPSVHHINYDKNLSIIQNCISLCVRCPAITNYNRNHWINFFQNLLVDKYGYKYENDKIVLEVI